MHGAQQALGVNQRSRIGTPEFRLFSPSPAYTNEGDELTIGLRVRNVVPGMFVEVYHTGSMASNLADWNATWTDMWTAACIARGCTYQPLTTLGGIITFTAAYDGQPILATRRSKEDFVTEQTQQLDVFLRNQSQGVIKAGVMSRWVVNTSSTPPGTPTLRVTRVNPSTPYLDEGDTLGLEIVLENMTAGTTFRTYVSNAGSDEFVGFWGDAVRAGAEARGCTYTPISGFFGRIEITPAYDGQPIHIEWTSRVDQETESGDEQIDFIVDQITKAPGSPDILVYGSAASAWVRDTSKNPTAPMWQLQIMQPRPAAGDTITYRLKSDTGAVGGGSVSIAVTDSNGESGFTSSFHSALQAAADAHPEITYNGAGLITASASWDGVFTWQRQIAGGAAAQKHTVRLSSPSTGTRIVVADGVCFIGGVTVPANPSFVTGVNLSGGEFGSGTTIPGTYGNDYRYPARPEFNTNPKWQEIDYWNGKGAGVFRLPVRWERIQRTLGGPLNYTSGWNGTFTAGAALDMERIDNIINRITGTHGKIVLLDVHNYGSYRIPGVSQLAISEDESSNPTIAHFVDLWVKLATNYAGNTKVWFGLMNEPLFPAATWRRIVDAVTYAIRARTNAKNRILVDGVDYSGAWHWTASGNGDAFADYVDPIDNYAFDVHQYLDTDGSGTAGVCTLGAGNRLSQAYNWANTQTPKRKLFVGEFAGGAPSVVGQEQCGVETPNLLAYMEARKAVFCGWTVWGGGMRWPSNYMFRLDPADYITPTDTELALQYTPSMRTVA